MWYQVKVIFDWLTHAKFLEAGHATEWISGIVGVGGAVVGAFVSVLWTEVFNRRTRERDDRRASQTAALSIYHKLNIIYSGSYTILKHYEEFSSEHQPSSEPKCLSFMGMRISDRAVWFSVEERMGILASSGKTVAKTSEVWLLNTLQDLDEGFNLLTMWAIRYGHERQKFLDDMQPEQVSGNVGTSFSISPTQLVKANALDMDIEQTFPMAREIAQKAFNAIRDLVYLPGKPLGNNFSVSLRSLDGENFNWHAKDAPLPKRWFQVWKTSNSGGTRSTANPAA